MVGGERGGAKEGLVKSLVGVLDDEDLGGGLDWRKWKCVAETNAIGTVAVGADEATLVKRLLH